MFFTAGHFSRQISVESQGLQPPAKLLWSASGSALCGKPHGICNWFLTHPRTPSCMTSPYCALRTQTRDLRFYHWPICGNLGLRWMRVPLIKGTSPLGWQEESAGAWATARPLREMPRGQWTSTANKQFNVACDTPLLNGQAGRTFATHLLLLFVFL